MRIQHVEGPSTKQGGSPRGGNVGYPRRVSEKREYDKKLDFILAQLLCLRIARAFMWSLVNEEWKFEFGKCRGENESLVSV